MCLAQGPQRSDAGEARTRCPSVSSQALYHWATALPSIQVTSDFIQLMMARDYDVIIYDSLHEKYVTTMQLTA